MDDTHVIFRHVVVSMGETRAPRAQVMTSAKREYSSAVALRLERTDCSFNGLRKERNWHHEQETARLRFRLVERTHESIVRFASAQEIGVIDNDVLILWYEVVHPRAA